MLSSLYLPSCLAKSSYFLPPVSEAIVSHSGAGLESFPSEGNDCSPNTLRASRNPMILPDSPNNPVR